ncbi:MBL fold metallo-hydrolase [Kitasatospora sp. NPDC092948]|uniref:MBL fold metallo-hydrolase n=1 Tax=Kitasatospora sp. NPDC092948 TaxID=3364088 RepID=UPI0037F46E23
MAVPFAFGWQQVAEATHAYLQPDGSWGWSNAGLVVGDDGSALLVDTLFTVPQTRRMLLEARRVLPGVQITTLVNTHSDGDHWWGNQLLAVREIVASAAAAEAMRRDEFSALFARIGGDPALWGQLPPVARKMAETFDFAGIVPTPPTRTFSGELELAVGSRTVRLIEVGPAHTAGDVLVHVPDADTLFAGDILFVGGHPVIHTGPIEGWIAALDVILALGVATVVPGHGPVVGPAEVRRQRDYLLRVRDHATAAYALGQAALEAAGTFDTTDFADLDDAERLVLNIGAVHRELSGDGTPDELGLMGCMHRYHEQVRP